MPLPCDPTAVSEPPIAMADESRFVAVNQLQRIDGTVNTVAVAPMVTLRFLIAISVSLHHLGRLGADALRGCWGEFGLHCTLEEGRRMRLGFHLRGLFGFLDCLLHAQLHAL